MLFLTEEQNIHWFVYNFIDLYAIKSLCPTAKHGTVKKPMVIACTINRTNKMEPM